MECEWRPYGNKERLSTAAIAEVGRTWHQILSNLHRCAVLSTYLVASYFDSTPASAPCRSSNDVEAPSGSVYATTRKEAGYFLTTSHMNSGCREIERSYPGRSFQLLSPPEWTWQISDRWGFKRTGHSTRCTSYVCTPVVTLDLVAGYMSNALSSFLIPFCASWLPLGSPVRFS